MKLTPEYIEACFLGLAIGDALGVPVEFRLRDYLRKTPVVTMTGYGVWNQPPGTWSDDSSLTFCTAESLTQGYDPDDMGGRFVQWYTKGYWGAHNALFDIGGTTHIALDRIRNGESALYSGEWDETSNGNGSLMRIMPAALYFSNLNDEKLYQALKEISGITHAHFRSVLSCFIYSCFVGELLKGTEKTEAWLQARNRCNTFIQAGGYNPAEIKLFDRLLQQDITALPENAILSSGYVLHTLEASIWTLLTTDTFTGAVLKAVNLGGDTDTTGCVTGALAGLYYGPEALPAEWATVLAREKDIRKLAADFTLALKIRG